MRLALVAIAACALLAGCGSEGVVSPAPKTVVGSLPEPTLEPETPAFKLKGDPAAGKPIFSSAGCVSCHTLADANATGTVGPNLDDAKPPAALVVDRVTNGKGAMPPFEGQLSETQIADVAAYVVKATGGTPP